MTRILAGRRSVLEALRGDTAIRRIYVEARRADEELDEAAAARRIALTPKARTELDRLSEGIRHQGVVAIADDYAFCDIDELLGKATGPVALVALDQITDPQNLGAIIRSAVTLGFDGVIIQKHRSATITASVVRASAGATEHAAIARVTNLQKTLLSLGKAGLEVIGLDAGGDTDLRDLAPDRSGRVLVVGSEGKGLRRMVKERCDKIVQIRQEGPLDSLNASVAAAIAMYEITGKRVVDGG
jgi:23S rRNA (guanosine2251-2'-O)-methyltransferase